MVGVVDFGLGNLKSIENVIRHVGGRGQILSDPAGLEGVTKLVLPGVGAFDHGMAGLRDRGWIEALDPLVRERRLPVLGICLGMQLMCNRSDEGDAQGLGWVDADVRRIEVPGGSGLKILHMGWNVVTVRRDSPLFPSTDADPRFYFVHSYHVVCHASENVVATVRYGEEITAAFQHGNVHGVQFHPEKSHRFGKTLIRNFLALP